ncbi:Organic hydroperoxide reductase OsmC/OhrA [Halovenus aranensis]|uniref:Organic hydroperoxide reductase OsmC/OhrA n=1 Tax=Halovenus aranensis TaxID=890420 RepID=A0A1G8TRJ8_9EURY|nr:OsmC family protein [Halovenus aranensis]SDJ44216.1 Organic hydroperoxide reductase OsmC/OhrA [Halovenus aranensis]
MSDINVTSTCKESYTTESVVGNFDLVIDATGEDGPDPNATLVADYASCFIPAFRVGANKEGFEDLGTVQVESSAELDDGDDLTSISFEIHVEADLGDSVDDVVARAEDICHVHSALREGLHADITVTDGADL